MDAIIAAGAVHPLLALLTPDQPAVQAATASTLCNLAYGSQIGIFAIVAAGAVPC